MPKHSLVGYGVFHGNAHGATGEATTHRVGVAQE